MTALVGILCKDGVVIGTDSSSTFGCSPNTLTIEQPTKKVDVIEDCLIIAGTGQVGLHQRFTETIKNYWHAKKGAGRSHIQVANELCSAGINDFASTRAPQNSYGALLAFPNNKRPQLCEFSLIGFQPEFKTDDCWFVSMGSGQPITDPFLGLLRRVFWKNGPPSMSEGIFATAWTLTHVIELNPGGINGPAQIAVLESKSMKSRILDDGELSEHMNVVQGAQRHLSRYVEVLTGANGAVVPTLPAPGSS